MTSLSVLAPMAMVKLDRTDSGVDPDEGVRSDRSLGPYTCRCKEERRQ